MSTYIGFDTSNYTTSVAAYLSHEEFIAQAKRLLSVREGEKGLRQSEAVFQHVRQLPELAGQVLSAVDAHSIRAVAASTRPSQQERSYMPCFLAGASTAKTVAATLDVPFHAFSHQQGHVAAALYGSGCMEWLQQPFLAFHVSGGTTDVLLVTPDDREVMTCRLVAHSLDLKAGQLIDRVGLMLGLSFPAGPALEQLAMRAGGVYRPKVKLEDGCCHLSGVENQCRQMLDNGYPPEEVALFCLLNVHSALAAMTRAALKAQGALPLLYAGGVMSNRLLQERLSAEFGGAFAPPAYSADNAAGIALLASLVSKT